jgi:vancomycin resistance protein VanW
VVPWGVGCTIVYNYLDLVVRNDTAATFQLRARVGEQDLLGELRSDRPAPAAYLVEARNERFVEAPEGGLRRINEIWRTSLDTRTGAPICEELLRRNEAVVKYTATRRKN